MITDAVFDHDGLKRYMLLRCWAPSPSVVRTVNFIGLNPSLAGRETNDATIRKEIGFATRWGFNRLIATNLIPVVSTDPWELPNWSGFDRTNQDYVSTWLAADLVVAAWGAVPIALAERIGLPEYLYWLTQQIGDKPLYCIGTTVKGMPLHPSRAAYTSQPVLWRAQGETS